MCLHDADWNNVGHDGLCTLANYRFKNVVKILAINGINLWEVVLMIVTDAHTLTQIDGCSYENEQINRDITSILNSKLLVTG